MSYNIEIEDLTPEQQFILNEQVITYDPPALGPKASTLEALGLSKKARACESCGTTITIHRCADGHIWRQGDSCNQRFCPTCADKLADRLLTALHPWVDAIEHSLIPSAPQSFIFARLYTPIPREHDAIAATSNEIGKRLRKLGASTAGHTWHRSAGFINTGTADYLLTMVLYWGPETSAANFADAFSDMRPSILTRVNSHARQFFTDLVRPMVPANAIEQAHLEYAFNGMRQIKALGPKLPPPAGTSVQDNSTEDTRRDLFTEDNPPVNNSPTAPPPSHAKCPFCRKHAVESLSRVPHHRVREVLAEMGWVRSHCPPS